MNSGVKKMNIKLKIAIIEDGRKQWQIGIATGISEVKLSKIIWGRTIPSILEMTAIAKVLNRNRDDIFEDNEQRIY